MTKGVYSVALEVEGEVEVGALGDHRFGGRYLYVGSAMGPGGLKRLDRHASVKERGVERWHVDYLLNVGEMVSAVATETEDSGAECLLASIVEGLLEPAVEGFGCSDCGCETHLFGPGEAEEAALEAHGRLRDRLNSGGGEN